MITNEVKLQAGAAIGFAGLMTWLNCRPLGIIFFTLLAAAAYKQIYPNARIQVPCDVQNNLNTIYESFSKLRKDKPGAFCVIISGGLITLGIAGQLISGTWLVLASLIGIFCLCAKYQIKLVNGEDDEAVKTNWGSQTTDHEIDEFLPDVSDEVNISLLKKVSENVDVSQFYRAPEASLADDDDSEVPSDLLLTSDKIPEIEEEEATASFPSSLEDEIILPRTNSQYDALSQQQQQQQHFGDSSDDSDDSLSRGLNFNDVSLPDAPRSGAESSVYVSGSSTHHSGNTSSQQLPDGESSPTWNVVNNLWDASRTYTHDASFGQKLANVFTNALLSQPLQPTPKRSFPVKPSSKLSAELSSDESDFELLDADDLNNQSTT